MNLSSTETVKPEPQPNSEQKADNQHVSQSIANALVGRRTGNKYRCSKCEKVVNRKDDRQWIKSFCEETGKYTRLIKI